MGWAGDMGCSWAPPHHLMEGERTEADGSDLPAHAHCIARCDLNISVSAFDWPLGPSVWEHLLVTLGPTGSGLAFSSLPKPLQEAFPLLQLLINRISLPISDRLLGWNSFHGSHLMEKSVSFQLYHLSPISSPPTQKDLVPILRGFSTLSKRWSPA